LAPVRQVVLRLSIWFRREARYFYWTTLLFPVTKHSNPGILTSNTEGSPEAFLVPPDEEPEKEAALPEAAMNHVLRLDTHALHTALEAERKRRGMTWAEVAAELPGFQQAMLTNLATGPLIGFPRVMLLTQWLRVPLSRFVRERPR
jgi:hypothetical protein